MLHTSQQQFAKSSLFKEQCRLIAAWSKGENSTATLGDQNSQGTRNPFMRQRRQATEGQRSNMPSARLPSAFSEVRRNITAEHDVKPFAASYCAENIPVRVREESCVS
jgi:hypothetical protein